jgi:holo-[acyl-carrier protein] synthase
MKLIGVGVDLIEVRRIRSLALKNKRFLPRVFGPEEIRYCRAKKKPWQHFAVRFAAKEAAWKALGRSGVRLKDILVEREATGKPSLRLRHRTFRSVRLHLSLSHTEDYATATVLAFKK